MNFKCLDHTIGWYLEAKVFVQTVRGGLLGGLGAALRAAAGHVSHREAPQADWAPQGPRISLVP